MFEAVPDEWRQEPLCAVAEVILGQSPPSSVVNTEGVGLPFIQGNAEFGPRHPSPVFFASDAPKRADAGDVLLSVRAPVGEVNVAEGPLCNGRGVAALRPSVCDPEFLFYAVGGLQPAFARLSQGSTFDAINGKELRQLSILLPPLDEQRRIAEVLRTVDEAVASAVAVVREADRSLKLLAEQLLVTDSEATGSEERLGDLLASIEAGVSVNSEGRLTEEGELGILKTSCVSAPRFDPREHKLS
jgi:type I restriction enzyme S subunit